MSRPSDLIVGTTATAGGSLGLTVQMITQFSSLLAALLNIIIALGGVYLLFKRIQKARAE